MTDTQINANSAQENMQLKEKIKRKRLNMIKDEWKKKYVDRLIKYGLTKKEAVNNYKAIDEIDYAISPELVAEDEITYMKEET